MFLTLFRFHSLNRDLNDFSTLYVGVRTREILLLYSKTMSGFRFTWVSYFK